MPHIDFDAARREKLDAREPIEFTIGGEHFTARPGIPFAVIRDHVRDDRQLTEIDAYHLAVDFVRYCLSDADHARFDAALTNPDEPVETAAVYGLVAFLVGAYTRPAERDPASVEELAPRRVRRAAKKKATS